MLRSLQRRLAGNAVGYLRERFWKDNSVRRMDAAGAVLENSQDVAGKIFQPRRLPQTDVAPSSLYPTAGSAVLRLHRENLARTHIDEVSWIGRRVARVRRMREIVEPRLQSKVIHIRKRTVPHGLDHLRV